MAVPDGSPGPSAVGRGIQPLDSSKRLPKVASVRGRKDSFASDCWQREVRQAAGARWCRGCRRLSAVVSPRRLLHTQSLVVLCRGKSRSTGRPSEVVRYLLGAEAQLRVLDLTVTPVEEEQAALPGSAAPAQGCQHQQSDYHQQYSRSHHCNGGI